MVAFPYNESLAGPTVTKRKRILFVGEAVSLAHVSRPAVLARWASEAGYDVKLACGRAFESIARTEGIVPLELLTIDPRKFYSRLKAGKFFYTTQELTEYVQCELKLIEECRPDLVVGDFRLSLDISATLAGVPLVSLNNAHWSPVANCRFSPPDIGILRALPDMLRETLFSLIRPLVFRTFARPLNVVRRQFGLPAHNDFRKHYTAGDYCAYLDLPELTPLGNLPRGHFFLGPVAWVPRSITSQALEHLGTTQPLAYVSLGSSGDTGILPNAMRALLEVGCDVVLSGVNKEQFSRLERLVPGMCKRCFNAPLLNPHNFLKRAVVTVCHGGSGTVYQSLAAGVPLLCLPGNPDQSLVAASVVAKGAGLTVEPRCAKKWRLTAVLRSLVGNACYRASARLLSQAVIHHDTRQQWLDFLERVLPLYDKTIPAERANVSEPSISVSRFVESSRERHRYAHG